MTQVRLLYKFKKGYINSTHISQDLDLNFVADKKMSF